ncbi:uncharacterized protein LOC141614127 [Silene latifolia]|uniref:uncharacterized protein LOC141614127 n=1 Tax=Silene latifolia TaxID=37657 RepID=UPI003D783BAA
MDLIEFSYNNKYHSGIGMTSFEALHGKKCRSLYVSDPKHVLEVENIELDKALTYAEVPMEILDRKVCNKRNGETVLLKVLWTNHNVEEAIWELDEAMRERYPHIFDQIR